MAFCALEPLADLHDDDMKIHCVGGRELLLIRRGRELFVIENKCGHFGVSLEDATVNHGRIRCSQHGFEFDLYTGKVVDRPFENCDPLRTFPVKVIDGMVGVDL